MAWRSLAYGSSKKQQPTAVAQPSTATAPPPSSSSSYVPTATGGKIYKILEYLRNVPSHAPVAGNMISINTGIILDPSLESLLQNNPKISHTLAKATLNSNDEDSDQRISHYAYISKYQNICDIASFLRTLQRVYTSSASGIPFEDVCDCYNNIEADLHELTLSGQIITIRNTERGNDTFYARSGPAKFYSDLALPPSQLILNPDSVIAFPTNEEDVTKLVRRGDALEIELKNTAIYARVSNALRNNNMASSDVADLIVQYKNATGVSSIKDPVTAKKIRYREKMDSKRVPIDIIKKGGGGNSMLISRIKKHGCTNDIRFLWSDISSKNWPVDRHAFDKALLKAGLVDSKTLALSKSSAAASRALKRKRNSSGYRKRKQRAIKISNAHLIGTELGDILTGGGNNGSAEFTLGATSYQK